MKIIKTNTKLTDFKEEPIKNGENFLTLGQAISEILALKTSNPTLAWVLGKKFACDEEVELKAEDIVFLKKEIETSEKWISMVTGQLIELLEAPEMSKSTLTNDLNNEKVLDTESEKKDA